MLLNPIIYLSMVHYKSHLNAILAFIEGRKYE
jgi:hypothetical protein